MGTLFNIEEGRKLRDLGISRADAAAHEYWKECAFCAVMWVATEMEEYTTDHIHQKLYDEYRDAETPELRALGAVMREAAKLGIHELTERRWKSERAIAHRNPKSVWHSLVI